MWSSRVNYQFGFTSTSSSSYTVHLWDYSGVWSLLGFPNISPSTCSSSSLVRRKFHFNGWPEFLIIHGRCGWFSFDHILITSHRTTGQSKKRESLIYQLRRFDRLWVDLNYICQIKIAVHFLTQIDKCWSPSPLQQEYKSESGSKKNRK